MASARGKAKEILEKLQRLGFCVEEGEALVEAAKDYDTAKLALSSARKNTGAGKGAVAGSTVTLIGCGLAETGVGAAVCLGGGAIFFVSGLLWTESASEAEQLAEEALDSAEDDLEDAMKDLCGCIAQHD